MAANKYITSNSLTSFKETKLAAATNARSKGTQVSKQKGGNICHAQTATIAAHDAVLTTAANK